MVSAGCDPKPPSETPCDSCCAPSGPGGRRFKSCLPDQHISGRIRFRMIKSGSGFFFACSASVGSFFIEIPGCYGQGQAPGPQPGGCGLACKCTVGKEDLRSLAGKGTSKRTADCSAGSVDRDVMALSIGHHPRLPSLLCAPHVRVPPRAADAEMKKRPDRVWVRPLAECFV